VKKIRFKDAESERRASLNRGMEKEKRLHARKKIASQTRPTKRSYKVARGNQQKPGNRARQREKEGSKC